MNRENGSRFADLLFGGAGPDWIFGHQGNDIIFGGHGNDSIRGGEGADTLVGGEGADDLVGGSGAEDYVSYAVSPSDVFVSLRHGLAYGGDAEGDRIESVENVLGSTFDDTLIGDDGNNVLNGHIGADVLVGADGDDLLLGGLGNDNLSGGSGNDFINGGDGGDTIDGGDGYDTATWIDSPSGIKAFVGDGLSSVVHLTFDAARDVVSGIERFIGSEFNDSIVVSSNVASIRLEGKNGDDFLSGSSGRDLLLGGNGNDSLIGGEGADTLVGGNGFDFLVGGSGNDQFVFFAEDVPASSTFINIIRDFTTGNHGDRIAFPDGYGHKYTSFSQVLDVATEVYVGGTKSTALQLEQNALILINDVSLDEISPENFQIYLPVSDWI